MNVLLGVCDHATAASTGQLSSDLQSVASVRIVLTSGSQRFVSNKLENAVDDHAEWYQWKKVLFDVSDLP